MDPNEVERKARELLNRILYSGDAVPRSNCEHVRCIVCDSLIRLDEASFVYDESGEFYGWECEVHI